MYHLPCICRTLVPKICVCPDILCVFQYIDMLTCVVTTTYNSTEQQGQLELLTFAMISINKDR